MSEFEDLAAGIPLPVMLDGPPPAVESQPKGAVMNDNGGGAWPHNPELERLAILADRAPAGPWSDLPLLVEADILTKEEAKAVVLAHEQVLQRCFVDLDELLTEAVQAEKIDAEVFARARRIVAKATRRGTPHAVVA